MHVCGLRQKLHMAEGENIVRFCDQECSSNEYYCKPQPQNNSSSTDTSQEVNVTVTDITLNDTWCPTG